MEKPLFSIIIPVYNTEGYIRRCLESVFAQKFESYEIIIVNDGSTDNSLNTIKEIISENEGLPIKLIIQTNKGLSAARNVGLKNASGIFVIWLDSDDALAIGALSKLAEIIKEEPNIVVNRIASYWENEKTTTECKYKFNIREKQNRDAAIKVIMKTKGYWYAAWTIIPKREFLIKNNIEFKEGIYHEDELWSPQVFLKSNTIVFNDNCYYINTSFRQGSIITKPNIKKDFDKLAICQELLFLKNSNPNYTCGVFLMNRIIRLLYTVYANIDTYKNSDVIRLKEEYIIVMKEVFGWKRYFYHFLFIIKKI